MAAKKSTNSKKVETVKLICSTCGKNQAIGNYYASDRDEFVNTKGKSPYCKKCIKSMIIDGNIKSITIEKFKQALKILNIPFVNSLYIDVANRKDMTNDKFMGAYISAVNLKPDIKNSTYQDSIMFEIKEEQIKNSKMNNPIEEVYIVTPEMKEFWGYGKPDEKYIALQKKFDKFMDNETDDLDYKKELDYKTLTELEILKQDLMGNTDKVGDLAKVIDMISKLSSDLNIKAIQKKEDKNNNRHYIIGVITKFIEDVKKEPILKPSDYMKGYTDTEFEKELELHFTAPLLESFEMNNPFKEEWENDKKKYEPTKEEIDAFVNTKGDDE